MKKSWLIFLCLFWVAPIWATDWYVRPKGGSYGTENGTSYANAWDGLDSVVWGGAGVVAGDTLYVCGTHILTISNEAGFTTQGDVGNVTSGSAEVTPTIIRGDYGGDNGIVWGAYIPTYEAWTDEGSNTYSITQKGGHYDGMVFEDVSDATYTLLTKASDVANCKATSGSFYFDGTATNDKLYVHCTDDLAPTGRIAVNRYGWKFKFANSSQYIKFLDIDIYAMYRWTFDDTENPHHCSYFTWDTCKIWLGEGTIFDFRDYAHHMTIQDCDLAYGGTAIYNTSNTNDAPSNCTYKDNVIHNMGSTAYWATGDTHAIGIQGGHDNLVEGNECYSCGHTIVIYADVATQELKDTIVRYNYVHTPRIAGKYGISFSCDDVNLADKSGNQCYYNIVTGFAIGFRCKYEYDTVQIYNNVAYNNTDNYVYGRTRVDYGPHIHMKNNVSLSPGRYHIDYQARDGADWYIVSDYNVFHPTTGDCFYFYEYNTGPGACTWAEWQALSYAGCTFDPNSISGDPQFVNAGGSYALDTDFQIPTGSNCKDAGENLGFTVDYFGNNIISGSGADIGVHEFDQGGAVGIQKVIIKSGGNIKATSGATVIIKQPLESFNNYIQERYFEKSNNRHPN